MSDGEARKRLTFVPTSPKIYLYFDVTVLHALQLHLEFKDILSIFVFSL